MIAHLSRRPAVALTLCAILLASCSLAASRDAQETLPMPDTISSYSDQVFLDLVAKYSIDDGEGIDYEAWHGNSDDVAALREHVALIAAVSPDNRLDLFPTPESKRRYYINTYNALVLDAVLDYWPLDSVRDVKLSLTSRLIPGKGFFYDRDIVVGGEETSLLKYEKAVLKQQQDPRLHFALNCASGSCPVIRPSDWSDEDLDNAAREFINDPANVRVADETVTLNRIFKWYRRDFPKDIYSYLRQYADDDLDTQLAAAIAGDFRKRYDEYDWSLNDGSDADLFQ